MTRPPGPVLRADEWQVQTIPDHAEAAAFITAHHYAGGAPNTSTARHGLYPAGILVGDLAGVCLWLPPTRGAAATIDPDNWRGVLACSRLVVAPDVPTNGASFLLAASMRAINRTRWPWFVTYADTNQGHTGAIYAATGWVCLGPVPAGDTWTTPQGQQVGRKRGGTTLTVAQMTDRGYTRNPNAPKIKWAHAATRTGRRRLRDLAAQQVPSA